MDGVILFVDDKVHECCAKENEIERTPENALFESLRKDYPVLGVKDLDLAQRAIKSIGAFSAIILDWILEDPRDALGDDTEEDIRAVRRGSVQEDQTLTFLEENDFFSLVYVYSNEDVEGKYGTRLRNKFGDRIQIQRKTKDGISAESIMEQIEEWRGQHQSLTVPLAWTATINLAIQKIFKELATADKNWIREIANSAQADGVSGEVFIIEILQYLLADSLVQNRKLLGSIKEYLAANEDTAETQALSDDESVARLFRRLLYTRLDTESPIMTGDICELSDTKFGIVVTPECDVKDVLNGKIASFELITFSKTSFDEYLSQNEYQRSDFGNAKKNRLLTKLRKTFNHDESKYHVLPSFPFDETQVNLSVGLDFSQGCERYKIDEIKTKRKYKLNSPFIQQLRQRYIAHVGRVGVPSLPPSLRNFNLK